MTLIFDTSALSPFLENRLDIIASYVKHGASRTVIPLAVDAELRFGFLNGSKPDLNLANYERIRRRYEFEIFEPNQDTAIIYAELATWASKHGTAFSHNDLWIAATCVQLGGELLTLDRDFEALPQLRLASV